MTDAKCTTYPINNKGASLTVATPIAAAPGILPPAALTHPCVAEDSGDYDPKPVNEAEFPTALQAIRARALRESAYAQIGRLLRLADLLDSPEPVERAPEALAQHGREIREASILLEEAVCELAAPLLKRHADD